MMKVGSSEAGAHATASHTASLAGSDQVYDGLFKQYGVYRARTIDELFDVAVVGAGLIGRAWAIVFARAGHPVRLHDADAATMAGAIAIGVGTFAARSAVNAGNAVHLAGSEVRHKAILLAASMLKALSNEKRLMILCKLLEQREMSVNALIEHVGLSQSALSQHLARMREENILDTRRDAQQIFYRVADPRVRGISVTATRAGITPATILFATEGQGVLMVDRRLLDPRDRKSVV